MNLKQSPFWGSSRNRHYLAAATLALLVLWLLRDFVIGGEVLYKRDIHLYFHALAETFVRVVLAGSWPVWNPYESFGQPFLANASSQVFYPITWLNLFLKPWIQYTVYVVFHLLWSGLGLYALARRLDFSWSASLVAAGIWIASGPQLSLVDLWHHLAGASWMPWVFVAADVAFDRRTIRHGLLLGAVLAAQILAGSADLCLITGLAVLGFVAYRHLRWNHPTKQFGEYARFLRFGAASVVVGLGLSAVLWLPTLELASRSERWALGTTVRTYWSVHPLALAETLIPNLWQSVSAQGLRSLLFESREPFLQSLYLGLPALGLVIGASQSRRKGLRNALAVAFALALVVSLGRHGLLYELAVRLLPPVQILRYPVKVMLLAAFAWSLLAGLGYDALRDVAAERRRKIGIIGVVIIGAAVVAVVSIAAALWSLGVHVPASGEAHSLLGVVALALPSWGATVVLVAAFAAPSVPSKLGELGLGVVVLMLVVGELAVSHRDFFPGAPRTLYTHQPEIVDAIRETEGARVWVYDYYNAMLDSTAPRYQRNDVVLGSYPEGFSLGAAMALAQQMYLSPRSGERWQLHTAYLPDMTGLYAPELAKASYLLPRLEDAAAIRLLRLGGVHYVVALHEEGFEALDLTDRFPGLLQKPIHLYAVPEPLPRAYAVSGTRIARGDEAWGILLEPSFDPRQEVVLPEGKAVEPAPEFAFRTRLVSEKPDHLRVEVELSEPGYLVVLDTHDPGWRATLDGEPAGIQSANLIFRAVAVPEGRHIVEFSYRPKALTYGILISLATLAVALVLLADPTRRLSTARGEDSPPPPRGAPGSKQEKSKESSHEVGRPEGRRHRRRRLPRKLRRGRASSP